ncbi:MAG TPA: Rieske 2Fe-2S domain-containing protein [Stellaceae bacterium]|nr:Rieske 2Fe-2S domain-containing protein [Stellaceae bacterium]
MRSLNGSARALVDAVSGEISREIYVNEDIYREEQERLFARAWLYIGHEDQVRNPGDYCLTKMGEESVILTRDRAGQVHAFLNSCRHRGMKVCRYDDGNTRAFICPYHAWTYDLDGRLIGVQDYENSYRPPFDRAKWGLVEVAQLAIFRGTIWATWDKGAPSFDDFLGEAKFALELGLCPWDGGNGATELLGSTQKWIVPCNWKFIAENFAGDALHVVSHRSVDMVGIGPTKGPGRRDDYGKPHLAAYPGGHGVNYGVTPPVKERRNYAASPATSAYFQSCWEKRLARLGDKAGIVPLIGTIFPNMSFHLQQPRTILVSHPRGPCETEMWRVYLVDKDAPDEVKSFLRSYYIRYSGPAGMTEQDDMENWSYATQASRGTIARRLTYHYKAGLGTEAGTSDLIPGGVTERNTSEQNPRALYRRWAEYMDADDWSALR